MGLRGDGVLASKHVGVRSRATELPCLYHVINMNIVFKILPINHVKTHSRTGGNVHGIFISI